MLFDKRLGKVRNVNLTFNQAKNIVLAYFLSVSTPMSKGAPFKGAPLTFGRSSCPKLPPLSANDLINADAFVSVEMTNACSIVHVVCLFMKMHLLALQDLTWFVVLSCASCVHT